MSNATEIPPQLRYTKEHEWARSHAAEVEVGITAFAAQQLGDVVFVELPQVGSTVVAGQPFGVVESVKSVSDLFAPVSGRVTAVNTALENAPEQVNDAPYTQGWIIRVQPDAPNALQTLLSADEYAAWIAHT
ncbi:MAG: glycine cleavage system protein GcvH [Magnetococcales bacterium]|nr:glycine cleavage system protein GcvH [Magnetococcales bacterium]